MLSKQRAKQSAEICMELHHYNITLSYINCFIIIYTYYIYHHIYIYYIIIILHVEKAERRNVHRIAHILRACNVLQNADFKCLTLLSFFLIRLVCVENVFFGV